MCAKRADFSCSCVHILRCGKLGREVEQVPCVADPVQEREGGILDFLPGEAKRLAVVGHRKALAERCFRRRGGGGIGSWASRNAPKVGRWRRRRRRGR